MVIYIFIAYAKMTDSTLLSLMLMKSVDQFIPATSEVFNRVNSIILSTAWARP